MEVCNFVNNVCRMYVTYIGITEIVLKMFNRLLLVFYSSFTCER